MAESYLLQHSRGSAPGLPEARAQASWRAQFSRFAWLAIPLYIAAVAIIMLLDTHKPHEPAFLLPILNFIFSTCILLYIAYLAARSRIWGGGWAVLSLGCGCLVSAVGALAGGIVISTGHINQGVIIHSCCMLCGGVCHCLGGMFGRMQAGRLRRLFFKFWTMLAAYSASMLMAAGIIAAALADLAPTFQRGDQVMPIRQAVLGAAAATFASAGIAFYLRWRGNRLPFLRWYSLGLFLVALGLGAIFLEHHIGGMLELGGTLRAISRRRLPAHSRVDRRARKPQSGGASAPRIAGNGAPVQDARRS